MLHVTDTDFPAATVKGFLHRDRVGSFLHLFGGNDVGGSYPRFWRTDVGRLTRSLPLPRPIAPEAEPLLVRTGRSGPAHDDGSPCERHTNRMSLSSWPVPGSQPTRHGRPAALVPSLRCRRTIRRICRADGGHAKIARRSPLSGNDIMQSSAFCTSLRVGYGLRFTGKCSHTSGAIYMVLVITTLR